MSLFDRVRNICLTPATEWPVIAEEPSTTGGLLTGFVAPLAAASAIAGFIGASIIGQNSFIAGYVRIPIMLGLWGTVFSFVMTIVGILVCGFIINALAPTFSGQKDGMRALKVAVYSFTPALVVGLLKIVPALGVISGLLGLYSLYLLYLGLPVLMKSPPDKALGYTVVTCITVIVVSVVWFWAVALTGIGALTASGILAANPGLSESTASSSSASAGSAAADTPVDKNSPLGRLQEFGKAIDESNKKMEAAQKSGDANAQMNAAMQSLGTILGGGRHVDPLPIDQMKTLLPASLGGLKLEGTPTLEKTGFGGLMVSKAEANYGEPSRRVTLEIVDSGGASGLMALASWAGIQGAKEDAYGSEKTERINGRTVHEKRSKGGTDEYEMILGDRFMVSAKSSDVHVDQLKAAVAGMDLARIEAMKDAGVQKP